MLYVIYCANHPELSYRGGQGPILHLEADLRAIAAWANEQNRHWAFSLSNAGAVYAEFRSGLASLSELDWTAIAARDFRSPQVKEAKQAEFLVEEFFPWELIERVGVLSVDFKSRVEGVLHEAPHRPGVEIRPDWYY